jgi:prepilin-type N-terminal cleavage/methylation domain-containing protein
MRNMKERARRGLSIIELLVVIAIIAVLMSILLPVVRTVRQDAQDAVCLANHKQFGVAFGVYFVDYDRFPSTDNYATWVRCWGGVDWYLDDDDTPTFIVGTRPLNAYVGLRPEHPHGARAFQCPRDDGMRHTRTDRQIYWMTEFGEQTSAFDGPDSIYAVVGNSYAMNGWTHCTPGAPNTGGPPHPGPHYRTDLGPDDVRTAPSRFVLVCDAGPNWAGRCSETERWAWDVVYGWWHGDEIGQMTFLDGSARSERMIGAKAPTYTFYMDPEAYGPDSSKRYAGGW